MCGIAALLTWTPGNELRCAAARAGDSTQSPGQQSLHAWWQALTRNDFQIAAATDGSKSNFSRKIAQSYSRGALEILWESGCERIRRRGPDAFREHREPLDDNATEPTARKLLLAASTLAIRDPDSVCQQPAVTPSGRFVLVYNGELYTYAMNAHSAAGCEQVEAPTASVRGNDLAWLCRALDESAFVTPSSVWHPGLVLERCSGPYALLVWDRAQQRLYFGRDALGRRSLLVATNPGEGMMLCSVMPKQSLKGKCEPLDSAWRFLELPPLGGHWYVLDAKHLVLDQASKTPDHLRQCCSAYRPRGMPSWLHPIPHWVWIPLQVSEPLHGEAPALDGADHLNALRTPWRMALASELGQLICGIVDRQASARRQDAMRPALGVLFSGGIDSLIIARALDLVLAPTDCIYLIHVSFTGEAAPFAQEQNVAEVPAGSEGASDGACSAVESMAARTPGLTSALDGSMFHPSLVAATDAVRTSSDSAPDTEQAFKALDALVRLSSVPGRFRFRHARVQAVDVKRDWDVLEALIDPTETTPMDIALGACLWYAAGVAAGTPADARDDAAPVRILFSGLGADELFAGYKGRHRTRFRQKGTAALFHELESDLNHLWWRNLGRDDRCVADHGCELRHPFLDEALLEWLRQLPVHAAQAASPSGKSPFLGTICDLRLPDGVGDKLILRLAATLPPFSIDAELAQTPKRAMQFGSRASRVLERHWHQISGL
jgi:asparagine synthetase B (glutamine-hydrolysing)